MENYLQIKIPDFYKRFLIEYNPKRVEIMFHGILGIEEIKYVYDRIEFGKVLFSEGFLPIFSDNCGNYYCIRENSTTLFFADHEKKYSLNSRGEIYEFVSYLVNQKLNKTAYNSI